MSAVPESKREEVVVEESTKMLIEYHFACGDSIPGLGLFSLGGGMLRLLLGRLDHPGLAATHLHLRLRRQLQRNGARVEFLSQQNFLQPSHFARVQPQRQPLLDGRRRGCDSGNRHLRGRVVRKRVPNASQQVAGVEQRLAACLCQGSNARVRGGRSQAVQLCLNLVIVV